MPTPSQKRRLGIFVVLVIIMLIALLVIIGSERFLKEQDIYYVAYKDISVSGLEVGSPVKYLGLGVGTIRDIQIDRQDISKIIIKIAVKAGTPIKKDAYADIELLGITGLKMIQIRGGSDSANLLEPGQFIQPGESMSEMITGKAEVIMEKIELLVNNLNHFSKPENLDHVIEMAENANKSFQELDRVLVENRQDLRQIVAQARQTGARLDTISQFLVPTVSEMQNVSLADTLADILSNLNGITKRLREADLEYMIAELSVTLKHTNQMIKIIEYDLDNGRENLSGSLSKLRSALAYLNEAARMINEDPSILLRGTEYKDIPDDDLDR